MLRTCEGSRRPALREIVRAGLRLGSCEACGRVLAIQTRGEAGRLRPAIEGERGGWVRPHNAPRPRFRGTDGR